MIKLKLVAELYQTDGGNVTLVQIENELGEITNNLATRVSAGEYILNIPDGFKNEVHVFCPQHRSAFNVVGSENNTFILLGTKYFDLLQDMRDNGGDTLLVAADNVHLNNTAQARMAAGVLAVL